ncbi:MAG: GNAT family N-acetyltransferase [Candidatus Babeliales bacterium]|jgi:GNAT superfamily N-acetyltransferase
MFFRRFLPILFIIFMFTKNSYAAMRLESNPCASTSIGIDEYFLNPARGYTLWFDADEAIEMTASLPPANYETEVLEIGLHEHSKEFLGTQDPLKIFLAAFHGNNQKTTSSQACGVIGLLISDNLCFYQIGSLTHDRQILQNFIHNIELFAVQNGAKRAQFNISEKKRELIDLFISCGYVVHGQRPDLYSGGYDYHLYKDLQVTKQEPIAPNISFTWLARYDECQQKKEVETFFSGQILAHLDSLISNFHETYSVGVFVRNSEGKVVGGCRGSIMLGGATPHLYVNAVWLDKAYRGKKLSPLFIGFLEDIARQFHCTKAHLNTADLNCPGLYQKLGYRAELIAPKFIKEISGKYSAEYDFYKDLSS